MLTESGSTAAFHNEELALLDWVPHLATEDGDVVDCPDCTIGSTALLSTCHLFNAIRQGIVPFKCDVTLPIDRIVQVLA